MKGMPSPAEGGGDQCPLMDLISPDGGEVVMAAAGVDDEIFALSLLRQVNMHSLYVSINVCV